MTLSGMTYVRITDFETFKNIYKDLFHMSADIRAAFRTEVTYITLL